MIASLDRGACCGTARIESPDLRQLAWSPDGQSIAAVVNGDELRIVSPAGALVRTQKIGIGSHFRPGRVRAKSPVSQPSTGDRA